MSQDSVAGYLPALPEAPWRLIFEILALVCRIASLRTDRGRESYCPRLVDKLTQLAGLHAPACGPNFNEAVLRLRRQPGTTVGPWLAAAGMLVEELLPQMPPPPIEVRRLGSLGVGLTTIPYRFVMELSRHPLAIVEVPYGSSEYWGLVASLNHDAAILHRLQPDLQLLLAASGTLPTLARGFGLYALFPHNESSQLTAMLRLYMALAWHIPQSGPQFLIEKTFGTMVLRAPTSKDSTWGA